MDLSLLQDILVLLGFSVVIVFVLQRLKLPSILGFLITGIIIGPYGLSLVNAVDQVETISQIGVILLLFVIGMELSLKQLFLLKKTVFIGGFLQVGLTVGLTAVIYHFFDASWAEAVFMGFLFSLSSTAIVLKILQDRNEMSQTHGRNALAILIFQDIIVVPMMLVTPIMAGNSSNITHSVIELLVKSLIVVIITIVSARYIIPRLMYLVAKTRSKELFLITTITICFAVADLTALAGLSVALGAFLAGLIISESEYSHQATSIILPFRELFTSFFFISVGMLMDVGFFINHIGVVVLLVVVLFLLKGGVTAVAMRVLKYSNKTVLLTAFSLFQVGEFAFILANVGIENSLLSDDVYQYFLAVSISSMLVTPFILMSSDNISKAVLRLSFIKDGDEKNLVPFESETTDNVGNLENHLIIVGYGVNGQNMARAAKDSKIPYVVLEVNADTVEREKKSDIPIIFGNATDDHILNLVNVYKARAMVVAVPELNNSKEIIQAVRTISQSVYLLVRTRYVKHIDDLKTLGADDVIPEELEASVEIFSRILHTFLIPEGEIENMIEAVRSDNYHWFQDKSRHVKTFKSQQIPDFDITALRVHKDSGAPVGKSLKNLDLRSEYGISVIAIARDEKMLSNISPEEIIEQNDLLYIQGGVANIEDFRKVIS